MSKEKQIEEMAITMLEASITANVEPVLYMEGKEVVLGENTTKILNNILEQAYIPFLAEVIYNADYRKQSGWISVDEKSPDEEKAYIIVTDGETVIVARRAWLYRSNSDGRLRCPANYGNGMYITHWMPLPKPPKMRKEDEGK